MRVGLRCKWRRWRYLLSGAITFFAIALPVRSEELQSTLDGMQQSEQWWDKLWQDTFTPTDLSNNISIYAFTTAVRTIFAIGAIFWLFQYGQKMAESKGVAQSIATFTQFLFPVLLAVLFLFNQGTYSRVLAYGLRDIANSWSEGVLKMQIVGQTVRSALGDQLVTQDAKNAIEMMAYRCQQMPQPSVVLPSPERPDPDPNNPLTIEQEQAYEYLECLEELKNVAEQKKQESLNQKCSVLKSACEFFVRSIDKILDSIDKAIESEKQKYTSGKGIDPFASSTTWEDLLAGVGTGSATAASFSAAYEPIFAMTQWLWINFLEMAMWLSALFSPIFIAVSIIPGRQNMFVGWLIGFLTIGLAKLAYVVVIGVVAAQLSSQQTSFASDSIFSMALGLFAPGVSLAVVTVGGIGAAMSFRSQSVAVVGAVASVATSVVATLGYSVTRSADKRR